MKRLISMRDALEDPNIFGSVLPGETWAAWRVVLIASQGEALTEAERAIFTALTGREREPSEPCDEVWGVVGRGGGKTRAFSVAAAYFAGLIDYEGRIAPGQRFRLPVIATSTEAAKEAFNYLIGIFTEVPILAGMVDGAPTQSIIRLRNRVDIQVMPASWKSVRGPTLVAAVCDELAFWQSEGAANPDKEILRAIRPGLARFGGAPLFVLSSPYAKKGELWEAYSRDFGPAGDARILVVQAPTLSMHNTPALQREVAREYERDPESAKAEYGAEFRDGISDFVTPEVVDSCTDPGVTTREPQPGVSYVAFIDPAGGSGKDSMTLAIGHQESGVGILDHVVAVPPPFSPAGVCEQFAGILKTYGISKITGDNYANEWPKEMMLKNGITYNKSPKTKGVIYNQFLPILNSRKVRLLDHPVLRRELLNLERRTAWGGQDTIDHPNGGHDDLINAAAGVITSLENTPRPLKISDEVLTMARSARPISQPFFGGRRRY